MAPSTAYIDMEFAGVYGTHQAMQIPVEIGIVIHDPDTCEISFAGRAFSGNIEVELWKNVINDLGKRIRGGRTVFNLAFPQHSMPFNRKFTLSDGERKTALRKTVGVFRDMHEFLQEFDKQDIGTLVFFARRREIETFRDARVCINGFRIRDLQEEIRSWYSLGKDISLDRASLVTRVALRGLTTRSAHFSITVPENYRHLTGPHRALGDAARIFIIDQEFQKFPILFGERLMGHLGEYEQRNRTENAGPCGENARIRPQTM